MSDMTLSEACGLTRNFGKFLKGMERLQQAADVLEASESVVRENERRVERLKVEITNLADDRQRAMEAVDAARADAVAAAEEGARAVAAAEAKAKQILDAANAASEAAALAVKEATTAQVVAERAAKAALAEEAQVLERIAAAKAAARATFG